MLLDDETGQLDRDALRRMMVADDNMRRSLDRITHPYILWQMAWEVVSLAAEGHSFAVLDIPLLFESGGKLLRLLFLSSSYSYISFYSASLCSNCISFHFLTGRMINYLHKIAVVVCERDLQIQRLMENRGMSEAESIALINVQMSLDQKSERADYVLENSGNLQDLKHQVVEIHQKLSQSSFHWKIRLGIGIAIGGLMGVFYLVAKQCGSILNAGKVQAASDIRITNIPIKKPLFNIILG